MAAAPKMDVETCGKLVEQAVNQCAAKAQESPPPRLQDSSDQVANSLAALSAAISWGSVILAGIAIVLAIGWSFMVRHWAKEEARKEMEARLNGMCLSWLEEKVPQMFRDYVSMGIPSSDSVKGTFNADQVAENVDDQNPV
jgi:hypothetical protein